MSLPVLILGGGGHAKVLINTLALCSMKVLGIVDADPKKWGGSVLDVPVIGGDEEILKHSINSIRLANGIGSVGTVLKRQNIYEKYKALGYDFVSIVHPSVVMASDTVMKEGVQIMAGTVIQPGAIVGVNTIINTGAVIDHDCKIGNHVHIAPGAVLSGGVEIGDEVHVGAGATVIQGIKIGKGSIIGAGSVVLRDVPEKTTVAGVPARVLK